MEGLNKPSINPDYTTSSDIQIMESSNNPFVVNIRETIDWSESTLIKYY